MQILQEAVPSSPSSGGDRVSGGGGGEGQFSVRDIERKEMVRERDEKNREDKEKLERAQERVRMRELMKVSHSTSSDSFVFHFKFATLRI